MAVDYGIKVVQSGADTTTTDIRQILMSSKYSMLKYHLDTTATITLNPGDTDVYTEVAHGLSYVPAHIVYFKYQGKQYFIPTLPRSGGFTEYGYAWASSSVVRCGYAFTDVGFNTIYRSTCNTSYDNTLGINNSVTGGNVNGGSVKSGLEYTDIGAGSDLYTLPQGATITSATLDFYINDKGSGGNPNIKTTGIDVDDCPTFGSDLGQAETTANTTQSVAAPQGERFGITVTSLVQEIVNRAGWLSGNNLGFYINDNGSASNAYVSTYSAAPDIHLTIKKSGTATVDFRCIVFKDKISS